MQRKYGWVKQKPDERDFQFAHHLGVNKLPVLPDKISLRDKMPPVFDQGQLSSCTANAGALGFAFEHGGGPYSRLQLYYNVRLFEGDVDQDAGGEIRDIIKVLANSGICLEKDWPYIEEHVYLAPPSMLLSESAQNKITKYMALNNREDYRQCLASGFPFIIGIQLFEEFESDAVAKDGIVPMPTPNSKYIGGHAVTVVGYFTNFHEEEIFKKSGLSENYPQDVYQVQNSWGDTWGDGGCFYLPAEYLENPDLACDAWVMKK